MNSLRKPQMAYSWDSDDLKQWLSNPNPEAPSEFAKTLFSQITGEKEWAYLENCEDGVPNQKPKFHRALQSCQYLY